MAVYIVLIVIIQIAALMYPGETNRKKFLKIVFLALFAVMAFRNVAIVGNDSTTSYYQQFLDYRLEGANANTEYNFAFSWLMKIVFDLTGNYQIFIIIVSAFVCYAYYRLIDKYSVNPYISVMWFLGMLIYLFLFDALKQAIAMAILCFAFDALMENRKGRFYLFVVLASLFHFPALVFLPIYILSKIDVKSSYIFILVVIAVLLFIFRERVVSFIGGFYNNYSTVSVETVSFVGTKAALMFLTIVIALIVRKIDFVNDRMYGILLYFMGIAMIFQMFCFYSNSFERLANYYYQFSVLFMPLVLENKNNQMIGGTAQTTYTIGTIVVVIFCIGYFFLYLLSGANNLAPYYFFWEGSQKVIVIH